MIATQQESRERRLRMLASRIARALRETPQMRARSTFSQYAAKKALPLQRRLEMAAGGGEIAGVESALDEFDRMNAGEDPLALRYALQVFLTHSSAARALGLGVPSLAERSPWLTVPSRTGEPEDR
jgi:hypothetical protein